MSANWRLFRLGLNELKAHITDRPTTWRIPTTDSFITKAASKA